jgi:hypothetical protein
LFSENFGLQIQILWMKYLKSEKSALFLQIWNKHHLLSNFCENWGKEEAPPSLEEDRGYLGQVLLL